MGKFFFVSSIAVSSAIFSFLITAITGTYIVHGETAIGVGLLWAFSLPAIVVLSLLTLSAYSRYLTFEKSSVRLAFYGGCVLCVAVVAQPITYLILTIYGKLASTI